MQDFDRASGIGGSDVAAVLGISPFRSPWDVWMEKTHDPAWRPQEETPAMRWGSLLEPVLAAEYERQTGRKVGLHTKIAWHPNRIVYAHYDGVVGDEGIWEGKTARSDRDWGEPPDGPIPEYYRAQVFTYLEISHEPWCDVSVLFPGGDFRTYRVNADPVTQAKMIAAIEKWWADHVVTRKPPPMDGSRGASRYLAARFPANTVEEPMPVDNTLDSLVWSLVLTNQSASVLAEEQDRLKNAIKERMGEYGLAETDHWRVLWKRTKGKVEVDWRAVANDYRRLLLEAGVDPASVDTIESLHSRSIEGIRPFRLTVKGEEQ